MRPSSGPPIARQTPKTLYVIEFKNETGSSVNFQPARVRGFSVEPVSGHLLLGPKMKPGTAGGAADSGTELNKLAIDKIDRLCVFVRFGEDIGDDIAGLVQLTPAEHASAYQGAKVSVTTTKEEIRVLVAGHGQRNVPWIVAPQEEQSHE